MFKELVVQYKYQHVQNRVCGHPPDLFHVQIKACETLYTSTFQLALSPTSVTICISESLFRKKPTNGGQSVNGYGLDQGAISS